MTSPTTDGSTVYFGHDTSLATTAFAGSFTSLSDPALATSVKILNRVSITSSLFFGDISHSDEYRDLLIGPPPSINPAWALNGTAGQDANLDAPIGDAVVANGLVYGEFAGEGKLHAFYVAAGTGQTAGGQAFSYPAGTATIAGVTTPVIASDGLVYVTSNGLVQALTIAASGSTTAATQAWKFSGTGTSYGAVTVTIASAATPSVIDANGVVYFGDGGGNLFAIISDSPGPMAKSSSTWPRAGGDNCNSGSSVFGCQ